MKWFLKALKQYADFDGRASRKEYWFFMSFYFLFLFLSIILNFFLGNLAGGLLQTSSNVFNYGLIPYIYLFGMIIPSIAVTIRRLHDSNKSGKLLLLYFIPLFGMLIILIFMFLGSSPEKSKNGQPVKTKLGIV